jgi:hypothetical protein
MSERGLIRLRDKPRECKEYVRGDEMKRKCRSRSSLVELNAAGLGGARPTSKLEGRRETTEANGSTQCVSRGRERETGILGRQSESFYTCRQGCTTSGRPRRSNLNVTMRRHREQGNKGKWGGRGKGERHLREGRQGACETETETETRDRQARIQGGCSNSKMV